MNTITKYTFERKTPEKHQHQIPMTHKEVAPPYDFGTTTLQDSNISQHDPPAPTE